MATISLCMIVKNEENTIEKCLNSVKNIVDEIIIVDTGSVDQTKEIVSKYTDKIFDFQWINDFSAARNFSFSKATMDYILWLDADDVILPEDNAKFLNLKETLTDDIDVVMMKYNTGFDDQGRVTFSYFRERLSKRNMGFKWNEPVHEYLVMGGNIINTEIGVTHTKEHQEKSTRNIEIYESLINKGKDLSPRGMYYYSRELRDHNRLLDAIKWFTAFLDSEKGWVEDNITACGELAKCYQGVGKDKASLQALMRSFDYDTPRGEICCQIGYYFMNKKSYNQAVFWFDLILQLEKPKESWGFLQDDCWRFIPCIECSVCYDHLGDYKKATYYNDKAAEYKPDSLAVLHNKKYFESKMK